MLKRLLPVLVSSLFCLSAFSQELNCRLEINTDQIEGTNKDVYNTLQSSLTEYINSHKWTDAIFTNEERIDVNFILTLTSASGSSMSGNLQIQASRPVYNSSYNTTLFNFKDNNFQFDYSQYDRLEFNDNNYESNLMSIMAFYCYVIIGLDFDSFSRNGGAKYFEKAEVVANLARTSNDEGWTAFASDNNRYALISNYRDNSLAALHEVIYEYHRLGLDVMSQNVENGKSQILSSLPALQTMNTAKPFSVALQLFAEAKMNELVDMFRNSSAADKKKVYDILSAVLPTQTSKLSDLAQ